MGFHGGGKGDFHGDFLADGKVLAGFDKRAAGSDVIDRCFEIAIAGLTMGGRQDLGESFAPVISFFEIFYRPFFLKKAEHFKNRRMVFETNGTELNNRKLLYNGAINMQYGNRRIFHNTTSNRYYASITANCPGGLDQRNTKVLLIRIKF